MAKVQVEFESRFGYVTGTVDPDFDRMPDDLDMFSEHDFASDPVACLSDEVVR